MSKIVPNCNQLTDLFYGPFGNGPGGAFSKKRGRYRGFIFKEKVWTETQDQREEREARCRALCNSCPLLEPCREFALIEEIEFGVWGGMSEGERRDFRIWCRRWGFEEIPKRPFLNEYLEAFWFDRYEREVIVGDEGVADAG